MRRLNAYRPSSPARPGSRAGRASIAYGRSDPRVQPRAAPRPRGGFLGGRGTLVGRRLGTRTGSVAQGLEEGVGTGAGAAASCTAAAAGVQRLAHHRRKRAQGGGACARVEPCGAAGLLPGRVVEAHVDRDQRPREVSELVECVDGAAETEDRLHQAAEAARLAHRREHPAELPGGRRTRLRQVARLPDHRIGGAQRRPRLLGGVAEAGERTDPGVREWLQSPSGPGQRRRRFAEVAEDRRRLVAERAELDHGRAQLAQEAREPCERLLQLGAARRGGLADGRRLVDERGDVLALPGQRTQDHVGVGRQALERAVLPGEDGQDLVRLAQRGVRALDDLRQLVTPRREAGAEVVQDQPEAIGIGLAHDVVDQVEVDRLPVLLERQEALALARLALTDHFELRRRLGAWRPGLRGLAVHELLAEQGLRVDPAGRVLAPILEAGIVDRHHHDCLARIWAPVGVRGLVGERDIEVGDGADVGARHADVLVER